ncbi:MAG: hypothetical protein AAF266_06430, partial [Planctomycetota bacterium]
RVEVMFPVEDPELKQRIVNEIVPLYLRDNQRARILESTGNYTRARPAANEPRCRSQLALCRLAEGKSPLADAPTAEPIGGKPRKPSNNGSGKSSDDAKSQRRKSRSR